MLYSMTIQLTISPETQAQLNDERFHHPLPIVQRRMEVRWLKSHNLRHELIAKLAGITENTVRDYFARYAADGLEGLKTVQGAYPNSQLMQHYSTLEGYFRANPPATIKEAQSKIAELTGIQRSDTQIRYFLKKTQSALPQSRDTSGESRPGRTSCLSDRRPRTTLGRGDSRTARRLFRRRRPFRVSAFFGVSVDPDPHFHPCPKRATALQCPGRLKRNHPRTRDRHQ